MFKIKKEDLKANALYNKLIPMYTIIIAIIYSYWLYTENAPLWSIILVPIVICMIGGFVFLYSNLKVAKKKNDTKDNDDKQN